MPAGWTKHENFVPDKTDRAFDLQMMKTSRAKDVSRTIKQDKTRLQIELKSFSRDFKKKMNQLSNETTKWQEKAKKLQESKEAIDFEQEFRCSSSALANRRGSMPIDVMSYQGELLRRRSKTMIDVADLPGSYPSGQLSSRHQSLDPTTFTQKQIEFFTKIARDSSKSQTQVTQGNAECTSNDNKDDDNDESPPASPPPVPRSRSGRRGSLPAMHLSTSRSSNKAFLSPLGLIEELSNKQNINEPDIDDTSERNDKIGEDIPIGNSPIHKILQKEAPTSDSCIKYGKELQKKEKGSMLIFEVKSKTKVMSEKRASPRLGKSHDLTPRSHDDHDNNDAISSVSMASKRSSRQLARSNSLHIAKNIRLPRRGRSATLGDDPKHEEDLAEQFRRLQDCRYLRAPNQSESEDCDLSNIFTISS